MDVQKYKDRRNNGVLPNIIFNIGLVCIKNDAKSKETSDKILKGKIDGPMNQ